MTNHKNSIALAFILVCCCAASADQITLKNGDRISGIVVKSDGKTIVFKGDMVGEIAIALENVTEIVTDKPLYVGLSDGRTVLGLVRFFEEFRI